MTKEINILKSAENYIDKFGEDKSVEELFIEFQIIVELHQEFNEYFKKSKHYYRIKPMNRSKRKLEKRKLFIEWFFIKNQNNKFSKEILNEIAEIIFTSERTVRNSLKATN